MRPDTFSSRSRGVALVLVAILAGACGGASATGGAGATNSAAPQAAAPAPPAAAPPALKTESVLPKSCGERVPVSVVSTAIGKTLKLTKELPAERGLLCYYDLEGSSPSPVGYAGRITYTALDHSPTRQEVNDYINVINKNVGVAKIEETSGLGDYSGWVTITIPDYNTTAWAVVAAKGSLMVDFTTFSVYTTGDRTRLSEVVRKALG